MLFPAFVLQLRVGPGGGGWTLSGLAAIAALLMSGPARAAVFGDVAGTADAATVSGPAPSGFYGPVASTSGDVASALATDQTGLLQSGATSQALGSVSSTTEGHATFGSSFGNSLAAWNGVFTNTSAAGAHFLLTAQWDRNVTTQAQRPTDVFVPVVFPGNVEPLADATLTALLGFGATQINFDTLASGVYQFDVGFIGAGGTLGLQLSVASSASIDAGSDLRLHLYRPGT